MVAPLGTGTTMLVALQLVGVPAIPLNVTVLDPCVEPKLAPVIVTDVPTGPDVGDKLVMTGAFANPTFMKVDRLLSLLYSVAIQSADRTELEKRTSSIFPLK
jgi:hypothetical protein